MSIHKKCLTAAALILVWGGSALADKVPLNVISDYLNELTTVEGPFTQINDDGTISTGTLFIKRPGRMRFEYNAPDTALVVAAAGAVVIDDVKSNLPPESYPLRRTPLSLILARNIDLRQANMVVGHDFDGTATIVTAQDPKNPEYGDIQMKFTGDPVELRQWVVRDSGGSVTTVILGGMNTGTRLPDSLFSIANKRSGRDR